MGKGSKRQKKDWGNPPRASARIDDFSEEKMDDEIDAFHKERDVVPLDVSDDDVVSDDDIEQPVFDFEDDNDTEDESQLTGLAAKIKRQEKALRLKFGGVEDEMQDDVEEEKKAVWGRSKHLFYGADNVDYEQQSSDEEDPEVEEAEALRLRGEEMKLLTKEDYGLDELERDESDDTDSDGLEKIKQGALFGERSTKRNDVYGANDDTIDEVVKRDLNLLSKEEQMEVVYSSAPELVNLLSELNDAHNQLESEVKPLLCRVKEKNTANKEGIHFLEVKQFLLLAYCQAIVFYLHLKSEGLPVRDHPVIARLVEIKNLLNKIKGIGGSLPSQARETFNQDHGMEHGSKIFREGAEVEPNQKLPMDLPKPSKVKKGNEPEEFLNVGSTKDEGKPVKVVSQKSVPVSVESMEMLKVRARLEEKLKKKAIYSSMASKPERTQNHVVKPMNRLLESLDDFDDEVIDTESFQNGRTIAERPRKLSQIVAEAGKKFKKPKIISGDHDLPARDDIGERRRKYELQALGSLEPELNDLDGGKAEGSEDEFYKEAKNQRAAKLAAKKEIYSMPSQVPSEEQREFSGRRKINYQMEKNKGLTRSRKKLTKIPRKKYKLKHEKAAMHRKGQVREIRRPNGTYGGEASGINTNISRSIRFRS